MGLSLRARVLRRMAPVFVAAHGVSLDRRRRDMERGGKVPKPRGFTFTDLDVAGVPSIRATPSVPTNRHIVYLHGGGYAIGSAASHAPIAARLARHAEAGVTLIDYRLAPEHPFPAALDDGVAATRALIEEFGAEHVSIAGDSAGGGLALAVLCALRDTGGPLPACGFLISPWTDLTASGDSVSSKADIDPMIDMPMLLEMADYYAGITPKGDPRVSPLFAEFDGLPALLVHVGSDEVLLDDSVRLAAGLEAAGVDVTFRRWDGLWHVFQGFVGFMPEANEAMRQGGHYLASHTP